jgi:signal transduction histidine kinase
VITARPSLRISTSALTRWPLSRLVPVALLLMGALHVGSELLIFFQQDRSAAIDGTSARLERTLGRLGRMAVRDVARNDLAAIQAELIHVEAESGVVCCFVADESGRSIITTGAPIQMDPIQRFTFTAALAASEPVLRLEAGRNFLTGAIRLPADLGMKPAGVIITIDLSDAIADAHRSSVRHTVTSAASLSIACIVLWWLMHRLITRRVTALMGSARSLATADTIHPGLTGNDELAQIDQALRESHRVITEQRAELAAQQAEREALSREITAAGEREQHRIGQDLHDDICQRLAAVKMSMQDLEEGLAEEAPALVDQADAIVDRLTEAIQITRGLARGLSPVELEAGGIGAALSGLLKEAQTLHGIATELEISDDLPELDDDRATQLYRITQECITNAVKHGQCSRISVGLAASAQRLVLRVTNDGGPFDAAIPPAKTSMVLAIMRHRATSIGGVLTFECSATEPGVTVRCTLPINPLPEPPKSIQ